jgi:RNA 2',3'-cyclic 3'-phosphodiesterase
MGSAKDGRRLFFALWPSDEFRDQLVAATHALARDSGGRVIPPENLHVTLLFLGQVAQARFAAIQQAGDACANSPAFELSFDRAETWRRSNLLCLTTSATPAEATELAAKLQHSLRSETLGRSEHEFRPHITLARDLPRGLANTSAIPGGRRRPDSVQPLGMKVNDFVLVESRPGPSGSQYLVIARWPLLSWAPTPNPAVADRE